MIYYMKLKTFNVAANVNEKKNRFESRAYWIRSLTIHK